MRSLMRTILIAALLASTTVTASGQELEIAKNGSDLVLRYPGSKAMEAVRIGPGHWAIVVAVGDPVRLVIIPVTSNQPGPDVPEPEAARLARDWVALVSESARGRAAALAEAFLSVAADIDSGKLTDVAGIISTSTERNRAALGEDRNAWLAWFEKLRIYMNGLAEAGKLKTPADHAKLFRDIAAGLQKATLRN